MIVKNIKKVCNQNKYDILIDDNSYRLNEDIVVEYRLVKNKELDLKLLKEILSENDFNTIYLKTEKYVIKYSKTKNEVIKYLKNKDVSLNVINKIVDKLESKKLINDSSLIIDTIDYYIRHSYGILYIKEKLYQKGFNKELIDINIDNYDKKLYKDNLIKLYNKIKNNYQKYDSYTKKNKIKMYLLRRGYELDMILKLDL